MKQNSHLTTYPYVEIHWVDANSKDGWIDQDTDLTPSNMVTRGWLYRETDAYIVVVNSLSLDDKNTAGGTNTIPTGMIISRRKLKVSNASSVTRHNVRSKPSTEEVHRE